MNPSSPKTAHKALRASQKEARAVEFALATLGCRIPVPLPNPGKPLQVGPAKDGQRLWRQIHTLPRPVPSVGGVKATLQVVRGDFLRKRLDQRPLWAGTGQIPAGFEPLDGVLTQPGRAPLYAHTCPPSPGMPVVFVLHGLYDSKLSRYVQEPARVLAACGFGVVVPDLRWHGQLFRQEWQPALGLEEALDLIAWAQWSKSQWPEHPCGLLGFSLGALYAILALAADKGGRLFRAGGIAVSPPGNLERTLRSLDDTPLFSGAGLDGLMPALFRRSMNERLKALGIRSQTKTPFFEYLAQRSDQLGAASAEALLKEVEPATALSRVSRPLLILASDDDPVFLPPAREELTLAARDSAWTEVLDTAGGGHTGQPVVYPYWFSQLLATFFSKSAWIEGISSER